MLLDQSFVSCKYCSETAIKTFKRERPLNERGRLRIPLCARHYRLAYLIRNAGFRIDTALRHLDSSFDPNIHYVGIEGNPPQPVLIPMSRRRQSYYFRRYLSKNPPPILSTNPQDPVCKWCNERKPPSEFYASHTRPPGIRHPCKDCHYLEYRLPFKPNRCNENYKGQE